jgi:hypothetical protein
LPLTARGPRLQACGSRPEEVDCAGAGGEVVVASERELRVRFSGALVDV